MRQQAIAQAVVRLETRTDPFTIVVGYQSGRGAMQFWADVDSKFPGEAIATQLIDRWWSAIVNNPPKTVTGGTGGNFDLDKSEIYFDSHVVLSLGSNGFYGGRSVVFDQPALGLLAAQSASINDIFKTYFRFRPSGDYNIYVTLGRVDWNWFGNAVETGAYTWELTSGGVTGPTFAPSQEFPFWNAIY